MSANESGMHRQLQVAGVFMVIGLLAEIASLAWERPLAFILFVGVGGSLTFIGLVLYLYSLVHHASAS